MTTPKTTLAYSASTILSFLLLILTTFAIASCGKDSENDEQEEDGGSTTLHEIVPQDYLNELKEMGFPIHAGSNPPDILGTYRFAPWRLDANNRYEPGVGTAIGSTNQNGFACTFANRTTTSIDVSYTGYYEGFENQKPWIMGSGNNFTVCRYIKMDACDGGNFRHNFVQLISGTKEGGVLRNIKMASIGLEALNPESTCDFRGKIEIYSDTDGVSNIQ